MKIGILTFHASHNYGSMLQAYALQSILKKMGHESWIINLRTPAQKFLIMPQLEWKHPKSSIIKFLKQPKISIELQRKYNRFENFLKDNLRCTNEYATEKDMYESLKVEHLDAFIVGSDQIWNTNCLDFNTVYLLDFNLPGRKIAYAPSLGLHPETFNEKDKNLLAQFIPAFDFLSTREERGAKVIKEITGLTAKVVLDPSLLLEKIDYSSLYKQTPIIKGDYIFYYSPIDQPEIFKKALLLSHVTGLKIVTTQYQSYYKGENIIHINDCGPCEFLNIINYSQYTIGKSFHLLAFSLIFEKEFFIITGDTDSRIVNILKPLELTNRAISTNQNNIFIPASIDYIQVKKKLNNLKNDSIEYLKNSLN